VARVQPGDTAPDFSLNDADGKPVSLADFRGQRVVLYFYPKAATPGCTIQACDFRDNLASLQAAGVQVLGVSPDPESDLVSFREQENLNFPLLSDPDRKAIDAYDVWAEQTFGDRTFTGVLRSTFIIDAEGKIEQALYGVKAQGHIDEVKQLLAV
jgi:peroxiredoxin Q/BCP